MRSKHIFKLNCGECGNTIFHHTRSETWWYFKDGSYSLESDEGSSRICPKCYNEMNIERIRF